MPLLDILHRWARETPRSPFLIEGDRVLTYAETGEAVRRAAGAFVAAGVRPGDRVMFAEPNSLEFCISVYGAMHAGAVVVLVNPRWTQHEIDAAVRLTEPVLLISNGVSGTTKSVRNESLLSGVEQPLERRHAPDGEGMMLMTSGTTGEAKAVLLTLENVATNAGQMVERKQITRSDRFLCSIPMFHSNGQIAALQSMLVGGASIAIMEKFSPATLLEGVARYRATAISGVPTLYQHLLAHHRLNPVDLSSLRLCTSGAAPMPQSLAQQIEGEFGARLLEGYGLSECTSGACGTPLEMRKPGSVGPSLPRTEIRVVNETGGDVAEGEVGELWIRGPQLMHGYFRNAEATRAAVTADGWLRSGDLGMRDADGFIWIKGRKKELIIRSGFNVYPGEVENALRSAEGIDEVAVVGLPDEIHGEQVHAAVVSSLPAQMLAMRISAVAQERLAGYKRPTSFSIHKELPKTGSMKVRKTEIAERLKGEPGSICGLA